MSRFCSTLSRQTYAGAAAKKKLWRTGQVLRVYVDSTPEFGAEIVRIANTWGLYGNISFSLYEQRACEIRVGFNRADGSWSHVGTDANDVPIKQNTMNLGWLYPSMADKDELQRVVLHEFGHALGLEHEHSSAMLTVEWNKPAVYDYYRNTQGWSKNDVDWNIFRRLEVEETTHTPFDERSIMLYNFPPEFTTNGVGFPWDNFELSEGDKEIIKILYPWG